MSVQIERRTFTVDEYRRMGEAGILSEDDRVELIEGEIVKMSPIGDRRAACVDVLDELVRMVLGRTVIVRVQGPIRLDNYSQPQPDITLLKRRDDFYRNGPPSAGERSAGHRGLRFDARIRPARKNPPLRPRGDFRGLDSQS